MGGSVTKYRRDRTYKVLEQIDRDIEEIEAHSLRIRAKYCRFSRRLNIAALVHYIIILVIIACAAWIRHTKSTWTEITAYCVPVIVFPLLCIFLKKLITWRFEMQISANDDRLLKLKDVKNKVIEEVKHNETYAATVEILDKFGEKSPTSPPTQPATLRHH